jgi:hypothetical protein
MAWFGFFSVGYQTHGIFYGGVDLAGLCGETEITLCVEIKCRKAFHAHLEAGMLFFFGFIHPEDSEVVIDKDNFLRQDVKTLF